MSVILKSSQFTNTVNLEDVLSIPISIGTTTYRVGDFVESRLTNATASISREDGNIQIAVDSDLEPSVDSVSTQTNFIKYADGYNFPSGVSYQV